MARTVSQGFRYATYGTSSGEVMLMFVTITQGANVVRIVSEDMNGVSYANGEIINYRRGSTTWLGCPFALDLLTDDDRLPRGRITMADPERTIGLQILQWSESPAFKIELMKSSDFSTAVGSGNARSAIGSPTPEYTADQLYLKNVVGDSMVVSGELASVDLVGEPFTSIRATQDRLPGLYR